MKKILLPVLKLLIAAAILGLLVYLTPNPETLLHAICSIHPLWLCFAGLFYGVHIFANAWRWHLLLKAQKIDCSLFDAFSLTMQSFFFSLVIPGGAIGGDLIRVGFLTARVPKEQKFDGAFTILMDRFTGMIGIFATAIFMLPFCLKYLDTGSAWIRGLIALMIAGSVAGLCGAVVIFQHRTLEKLAFYRWGKNLADRLSHGLFSRLSDALDSYRDCKKEMLICILASIVFVNLFLGVAGYFVARGIQPEWTGAAATIESITLGNIAGLLPITPSGVGARDFVVTEVMKSAGMSASDALALALAFTGLIIGFSLSGGFFFLLNPNRRKQTVRSDGTTTV